MTQITLYSYWTSSCSWRVRAALHVKNIPFIEKFIDIVEEKQHLTEEFRKMNPAQKVPVLVIDGETIVESMAILQYLEDTRPEKSLTPSDPLLKARMREIVETIVSGIMPLQNISLKSHFDTEEKYLDFGRYWIQRGLQTLEDLLKKSSGRYCVGDELSLADLCLVPQTYNAVGRFKLDISKFPTVSRLYETLLKEETFSQTHPNVVKSKI